MVQEWTPDIEELAHKLKNRAARAAWVYAQMEQSAQRWGSFLLIAAAIASGLVSLETLFQVSTQGEEDGERQATPGWVRITTFVCSALATAFVGLNTLWKPAEIGAASRSVRVKMLAIERTLSLQVALEPRARQRATELMRTVFEDLGAATIDAPSPYAAISRKADERFGSEQPLAPPNALHPRSYFTWTVGRSRHRPSREAAAGRGRGGAEAGEPEPGRSFARVLRRQFLAVSGGRDARVARRAGPTSVEWELGGARRLPSLRLADLELEAAGGRRPPPSPSSAHRRDPDQSYSDDDDLAHGRTRRSRRLRASRQLGRAPVAARELGRVESRAFVRDCGMASAPELAGEDSPPPGVRLAICEADDAPADDAPADDAPADDAPADDAPARADPADRREPHLTRQDAAVATHVARLKAQREAREAAEAEAAQRRAWGGRPLPPPRGAARARRESAAGGAPPEPPRLRAPPDLHSLTRRALDGAVADLEAELPPDGPEPVYAEVVVAATEVVERPAADEVEPDEPRRRAYSFDAALDTDPPLGRALAPMPAVDDEWRALYDSEEDGEVADPDLTPAEVAAVLDSIDEAACFAP